VAELVTSSEDLAIVSHVINLGHSLGLKVVAEGVETSDQLCKLREMGCDQAQGFKWRHPAAPDEVTRWLMSLQDKSASI
jgi:EAL domain-containing protein (putative c-di-GMP-specific phosphodiesterase class I)